jgi:L-cysteine S-thiosulfotransferase
LPWAQGELVFIPAYMSYTSRGNLIEVDIPTDARAIAAYEAGKEFFYRKRGQFNLACADCHVYSSGLKLGAQWLSPAINQINYFPIYRANWGEMGSLHRRYADCMEQEQVRAKAFEPQSEEYRNLEYFQTYMSKDLAIHGPDTRP